MTLLCELTAEISGRKVYPPVPIEATALGNILDAAAGRPVKSPPLPEGRLLLRKKHRILKEYIP